MRADEDHRAQDVEEQREVPVVGSDRREEVDHAPGFQIMSTRSSTTTTVAAAWNDDPARGPVQREQLGVRAGLAGRLELLRLGHALHVRRSRPLAEAADDDPEHDGRDDPAVPDVVVAVGEREPDAEDDRPSHADCRPGRCRPSRWAPCESWPSGVSARRHGDDEHPEQDEPGDDTANALNTWSARIHSSKLTRRSYDTAATRRQCS